MDERNWITASKAAKVEGVSEETIARRCRAGEYRAEKFFFEKEREKGGRPSWKILVSSLHSSPRSPKSHITHETEPATQTESIDQKAIQAHKILAIKKAEQAVIKTDEMKGFLVERRGVVESISDKLRELWELQRQQIEIWTDQLRATPADREQMLKEHRHQLVTFLTGLQHE